MAMRTMKTLLWTTLSVVSMAAFSSAAMAQTAGQRDLMQRANSMNFSKLEYYDQGIYGKRGNNVMYLVTDADVQDMDNFYASMVRVLSEKYGCFMRARTKTAQKYQFRCRDGRTIVIQQGTMGQIHYFSGKQFDRTGDEIVINQKPNFVH